MVHDFITFLQEDIVGNFPDNSPSKTQIPAENITMNTQVAKATTASNTTQHQMLKQMQTMHILLAKGG